MLFEATGMRQGRGGLLKRITEHLNPRGARVVALESHQIQKERSGIFKDMSVTFLLQEKWLLFGRVPGITGREVEPVMGFCSRGRA